MPSGFKVATHELYMGWKVMRSGGVPRLAKKIKTRGWSFTPSAEGLPHSGVGKTSEEAIDSALHHVLQRVGAESSAVEVERIELTQYPWFYLAKVQVNPYRIQEAATPEAAIQPASVRLKPAATRSVSGARAHDSTPSASAGGYAQTLAAMPTLKDLLTVPYPRPAQV